MIKSKIFHPFLFVICPILFIFSINMSEISLSELIIPVLLSLGVSILLLFTINIKLKSYEKSALIVSLIMLWFFSGGNIFNFIMLYITKGYFSKYLYFAVYCILLGVLIYLISKLTKYLKEITSIANIIAITLFVMTIFNIAIYQFNVFSGSKTKVTSKTNVITTNNIKQNSNYPDIYYIILDGYARPDVLKKLFNYDDSAFLNFLKGKGFYIASKSTSNYPQTKLSLSSSMNMEYLDYGNTSNIENIDELKIKQIRDNKLIKTLKAKGYKIVNYKSSFVATSYMENIDLNVECIDVSEFNRVLLENSIVFPFTALYYDDIKRQGMQCSFDKLAQSYNIDGPKFVFAHIWSPHGPYLFGPNGEKVKKEVIWGQGNFWKQKDKYIGQLIYTNKMVEKIVDNVLKNSKRPTVIVLQADHGSASTFPSPLLTSKPTKEMLNERFKIFNVYYLPDNGSKLLYESITPVNTFRLILSHYLGENLPLLKEENYYVPYVSDEKFTFTKVTDKIDNK